MNRRHLLQYAIVITLVSLSFTGAAQIQPKPAQNSHAGSQQPAATHTSNHKQSEGERILAQNCARCHTPPDGFSPRISGTIVLHMRVRASLGAHDERELLRFFNP
ncbi:MAG TPA: cytochrome c [Acidobacteriaceae bacterium]|nr:cytochrome c [Acidobacteriaceae bacterium]